MKYVMFKITQGDLIRDMPIIFPDSLISCHDKSETLKLEAREEDSNIINTYDYFFGLRY